MGQTGASHPPEEFDENCAEINLINNMVQDQDSNVQHDSIPTADHKTLPIPPENLMLLSDCLTALWNHTHEDLLHLVASEPFMWDPVEVMRVGCQRNK